MLEKKEPLFFIKEISSEKSKTKMESLVSDSSDLDGLDACSMTNDECCMHCKDCGNFAEYADVIPDRESVRFFAQKVLPEIEKFRLAVLDKLPELSECKTKTIYLQRNADSNVCLIVEAKTNIQVISLDDIPVDKKVLTHILGLKEIVAPDPIVKSFLSSIVAGLQKLSLESVLSAGAKPTTLR